MINIAPEFQKLMKHGLHKVYAEKCKRSFAFFVQHFWQEIEPEPLIWNWHLQVFCDELEVVYRRVFERKPKLYDLVVNVPPGTSKSRIFTIMAPVWGWINDDTLKFINGSYAIDLSLEHADASRDIIKSRRFQLYFPLVQIRQDKDVKGNYHTRRRGSRYATSVGGTVTGMHAHIITIDDPLNPKKAASEKELQAANHWMEQTLSTRKINKEVTPTILVMQRLSELDPAGMLLEKAKKEGGVKKAVRHICLPGEIIEGLGALHPPELAVHYVDGVMDVRRMNRQVLRELEADLGQYGYAGQILQRPAPPGGGMFKVERLRVIHGLEDKYIERVIRYWDNAGTSAKDSRSAAFTAGVKMAKLKPNNPYAADYCVMDVVRGQWESEEREQVKLITARQDGVRVHIYQEQEPGSSGKDVARATVKHLAGFVVHPEPASGDKVRRADPFSVQVNWGNVVMLHGDWNTDYTDELKVFPFGRRKDQVDSSSGAFNKLAHMMKRAGVW